MRVSAVPKSDTTRGGNACLTHTTRVPHLFCGVSMPGTGVLLGTCVSATAAAEAGMPMGAVLSLMVAKLLQLYPCVKMATKMGL